jgi:hypothetical protein
MVMKHLTLILASVLILSCSLTEDNVPAKLKSEITAARQSSNFTQEDFFRINDLLFKYEAKDSLGGLIGCVEYQRSISELFNSPNDEKRVLAYRLIGVAIDTTFNSELIKRINSDESSLLKTWCSNALMANKTPNASDHLFRLFSSYPDDLPVDILINKYVSYDKASVKNSCWKFIDSPKRNEQILAIQCLSNYEKDRKLEAKLYEFLSLWDNESKGWVISSMAQQKMENLKPVLEKYVDNKDLTEVIIRALESSPTKTDIQYAEQLKQ